MPDWIGFVLFMVFCLSVLIGLFSIIDRYVTITENRTIKLRLQEMYDFFMPGG